MCCQLIISSTLKELVVTTVLELGLTGIRRRVKEVLSDFSYGEFVFYQNGMPEFYCSLFLEDGRLSNIGEFLKGSSLSAESLIAELIRLNGFGKVTAAPPKGLVVAISSEKRQKCLVKNIIDCVNLEQRR